ncbi:MAG: cation:proton antiporter [Paracoccaceae bacterium]
MITLADPAVAADWASWALLAACALVLVRLVLGPTTADRAVALDKLGVILAAFAGLRALATGEAAYLDVAMALALSAFLTTLAFARFIARRSEVRENAFGPDARGARDRAAGRSEAEVDPDDERAEAGWGS